MATPTNKERGAVLVVAMVILLVMTLIGAANMQSSGMQQKMTSNAQARQEAFQVAESILAFAEDALVRQFRTPAAYDKFLSDCPSGDTACFDDTCAGGLCFFGSFPAGEEPGNYSAPNTPFLSPHIDASVWSDANRHIEEKSITSGAFSDAFPSPRYVVEFLGFVSRSATAGSTGCSVSGSASCVPMFRITAYAERDGVRARVMLQSKVRILVST